MEANQMTKIQVEHKINFDIKRNIVWVKSSKGAKQVNCLIVKAQNKQGTIKKKN